MTNLATLYQTDYTQWTQRNAELLRAGRFKELDIEHLLEELSDTSKSDRRELHSRRAVLAHKETCLPLTSFPTVCPYLTEQLLDDAFYPDSMPENNCIE